MISGPDLDAWARRQVNQDLAELAVKVARLVIPHVDGVRMDAAPHKVTFTVRFGEHVMRARLVCLDPTRERFVEALARKILDAVGATDPLAARTPEQAVAFYADALVGVHWALRTASDEQVSTFRQVLAAMLREDLTRRRVAYLRVDYEPVGAIRAALDEAGIPWDNRGRPFGFTKSITRVTADGREVPEDPEVTHGTT